MALVFTTDDATWIFGYGSLVWRPAFEHLEQRPAYVTGWTRRFWQSSTDHRGVPERPGRVVTLIPEADARCWGMAYAIAPARLDAVLDQLDVREQQGYARQDVPLHFADGTMLEGLMYVATSDNPAFVGTAPLHEIRDVVLAAHGPSGSNLEYVLRLAAALRAMNVEDPHVFALAAACES